MFVITKTLGVKANSKVNAYNLELQPCTILSLYVVYFGKTTLTKPPFFPPESIFEKKETEILWSWCWGRRRQPRSVCLSICLFVCLPVCLSVCRLVGLAICLSVCPSISLSICLSAGWSVGRSVCLAFYIEQKVIYEASIFFNPLSPNILKQILQTDLYTFL